MTFGEHFIKVQDNPHLLLIAFFGGVILLGFECVKHASRKPEHKYSVGKYIGWLLLLGMALPLLGSGVLAVYLMNGDVISPMLALQIGLSSPAIVQSLMVIGANKLAMTGTNDMKPGSVG